MSQLNWDLRQAVVTGTQKCFGADSIAAKFEKKSFSEAHSRFGKEFLAHYKVIRPGFK